MSVRVVVGADGALGKALVTALGAHGVGLRHPSERLDERLPELTEADVVFNVSGPRVRPGLGWADYLREHVGTSVAVARSMRPGGHLVHFSSAAVYGASPAVIRAETPEAPRLFPNPSYAWAKLAGEHAVRAIARERGLGLTVLRPTMVYGVGVTSALDTILSLAQRGVRLSLRPAGGRQHGLSLDLLVAILEGLAARGPQEIVLLACDPFVFANRDLEAAVAARHRGLAVPAPVNVAEALLRRWPMFPDREPPGVLAAFAFLGLDNEFDWRHALRSLAIDAGQFSRERTLDPYLSGQSAAAREITRSAGRGGNGSRSTGSARR
jgi:UDP-glucose 4-epimerase